MPSDDLAEGLRGAPPQPATGPVALSVEPDAEAGDDLDEQSLSLVFAWAPFPVEFGGSWWLDLAPASLSEEPEPALVFAWAPFPVEFGGSWWLDLERATEPQPAGPTPRHRSSPLSPVGSLAVHLLTLLVLMHWTGPPTEFAGAIPVQLVLEKKAPVETVAEAPTVAQNEKPPPPAQPPPKVAEVAPPPPKPAPPNLPPPKPPRRTAEPIPTPSRTPRPQAVPSPAPQTAPVVNPAPRAAAAVAPGPGESDYFSYLVTLTRRHLDLLPPAFLAGRRGETILSVVVLDDGTIANIAVKHSSGYPDIDARIAQMVAAVGHFPPPPTQFRRPDLALDFKLVFPDALQ